MLFSLLLSLTNPADACVAPITVDAVFPQSGKMEVAPNARFQVRLSCEQLLEDPQFVVEQDGEVIEAEVRLHRRMITADSEAVFAEVIPLEKMEMGSSILLSTDYFGMRTSIATFVVGEELAAEEILETPEIYWISTYDVSYEEPEGECGLQKEGEVYFDIGVAEEEGLAIRLYEIDPELRGQELFVDMLQTPFHTVMTPNSWDDMSALIPAEKLQSPDMCFTATFINEAGVESMPSEVRCISDMQFEDWVCGTGMMMGCSTMQPIELGWMAMMMGTLGLFRRRWH
jgi:hypothetical protein